MNAYFWYFWNVYDWIFFEWRRNLYCRCMLFNTLIIWCKHGVHTLTALEHSCKSKCDSWRWLCDMPYCWTKHARHTQDICLKKCPSHLVVTGFLKLLLMSSSSRETWITYDWNNSAYLLRMQAIRLQFETQPRPSVGDRSGVGRRSMKTEVHKGGAHMHMHIYI